MIRELFAQNPIVLLIQHLLNKIQHNNIVDFLWIPGHVGISGNEKADCLAKYAATSQLQADNNRITPTDFKNLINSKFSVYRNQQWSNVPNTNKLSKIKTTTAKWPLFSQNRRESVVLSRIWLYTHGHLMNRSTAPVCQVCNVEISIQHLIEDCPQYTQQRTTHHITSLKQSAGDDLDGNLNVINFLKDINLYDKIL